MTLLQHYYFSLLSIGVSSFLIGLWAIFQKGNEKTTRFFLIYSAMISFWGFCQAQAGITENPARSLFWIRMLFLAVIPAPGVLTYFFTSVLKEKPHRTSALGWVILLGFLPFLYSDQFLSPGGQLGFLRSFPKAGPLFLAFNLVWVGWVIYALSLLARKAVNGEHPQRKQARFLLTWFAFGYATGSMNFLYLYGICLPPFHPFISYGVPISWMVLAYGVFAYRLFDARVVVRKSLVYSLLVTSLTICYFGLVYGVERALQVTLGYQTMWVSLTAFALMALAFQPLKVSIQRVVDWLIFRVPQEALVKRVEKLEEQIIQTEKLKAISTLAAGMAHEIKNPLTAIKTFAEFIPEKQNDPIFMKRLHHVLTSETQRIQEVVQELLEFAKPKTPNLKPVDPGPIIKSTVDFLSGDLSKHSIQWSISCQHNGATIQADSDQLRQVLINLIQNAADAMPNGGTLTLATQVNDGYLELTVTDTGEGIPKELLPKIFDPFVTTKPNGTGLGLAMVQNLIRAHHVTISASSTPARGTTFTLRFPL